MRFTASRSASPAAGLRSSCSRLPELGLTNSRQQPVTAASVVDHQQAFSIYFDDPWGHLLEVTTYDYGEIAAWLKARQ